MTEITAITRNADGNFVGSDGFVVPKDFNEFHGRFPLYIRDWVRKRNFGGKQLAEIQDLTNDLCIHMMTLPEVSVFRDQGMTDRVQAFDPNKGHIRGATGPRFFHFVKGCLNRAYLTILQKRSTDQSTDTDAHRESSRYVETIDLSLFAAEFRAFVAEHGPELLPALQVICSEDTPLEAGRETDRNREMFNRSRGRLETLRHSFENGDPVPRLA